MEKRWIYPVASVLLLTVMATSVLGAGSGVELYCYQCLEGEFATFCNLTSNEQLCRGDDDVCFVRVTNDAGVLWSWKGCMARQTCDEYMAQNGDMCRSGIVTAQCAYCCQGNLCNYDRFTYQASTAAPRPVLPTRSLVTASPPKLGTPTTTPSLPPDMTTRSTVRTTYSIIYKDDMVTPPPGSCVSADISKCTDNFRYSVSLAVSNPRQNVAQLCRTMPTIYLCIAEATKACCRGDQLEVTTTLDFAVRAMWNSCPKDCDSSQGITCSNHVLEKLSRAIIYQDLKTQCQLLKKELLLYQTCIVRTVGACQEKRFVAFNRTLGVLEGEAEITCNGGVPPTTTTPGPSTSPTTTLPCIDTFTLTRDTLRFGATGYAGVYELTQCRALCLAQPACTGLDYDNNDPPSNGIRCWVHTGQARLGKYPGVDHYERVRCDDVTTSPGQAESTTPAAEQTTTSTTSPPTEPASCQVEQALRCILVLSKEVNKAIAGHGNFNTICTTVLDLTESCVAEKTKTCSPTLKERSQRALQFVKKFIGDNCYETAPEECDTTGARTCIMELWKLVDEGKDIGAVCKKIPETLSCVAAKMKGCTEREQIKMNTTTLQYVLDRIGNKCEEPVEVITNGTITVCEGLDTENIEYKFRYDPNSMCEGEADCQIYVDFVVPQTSTGPKCRDGQVYTQFVVADACSRSVSSTNWQEVQRVAIAARLDFRHDGNQTRHLVMVMRKVVGGQVVERRTITTFTVLVCDRNFAKPKLCHVVNDPHMTTFDQRYYNNYYEGFFTLYRHKKYPYEVQTVFQRCHPVATCNCAVAVKSGDFVFFADMCRRKRNHCGRGGCHNLLQTYSYVWDKVTPGTRIFRKKGGRQIDIWLPHGTVVRIQFYGRMLNVVVYGSVYDIGQVEGLCGFLDGNARNDFTMANGQVYNGRGSEPRGQPRPFSLSWRVPAGQEIHRGVPQKPFRPQQFCDCPAGGVDGDAAMTVQPTCNKDVLSMNCHYDPSGEMNFREVPTIKSQQDQLPNAVPRSRRDVTGVKTEASSADEYDIDVNFEPRDDPVGSGAGTWAREDAERFCDAFLTNTFQVSRHCLKLPDFDITHARYTCVEDIQLTNGTSWAMSALETMKAKCVAEIENDEGLLATAAGQELLVQIEKHSCINQCNGRGTCNQGVCVCDAGFAGDDCAQDEEGVPQGVFLPLDGLCDAQLTDCRQAVVYADSFIDTDRLACHLQEVLVNEEGIKETQTFHNVTAFYFTFNQIVCQLPKLGSFYIDVSNDGVHQSNAKKLFLGHDSACHLCQIGETDDEDTKCIRKDTGCLVDGRCYATGQTDDADECYRCDPSKSKSSLSVRPGVECQSWLFPVIAVCLAVFILLGIVLACYCLCRRQRSSSKISKQEPAAVYEHSPKKSTEKSHMVEVTFDVKPSDGAHTAVSNPSYTGN